MTSWLRSGWSDRNCHIWPIHHILCMLRAKMMKNPQLRYCRRRCHFHTMIEFHWSFVVLNFEFTCEYWSKQLLPEPNWGQLAGRKIKVGCTRWRSSSWSTIIQSLSSTNSRSRRLGQPVFVSVTSVPTCALPGHILSPTVPTVMLRRSDHYFQI